MTETQTIHSAEHGHEHTHSEHAHIHQEKEKFNFVKWVRGKNTQEFLENGSYVLMVVAAILVSGGLLVGSFVPGVIIVASIGAFILLPGLVIYVISQLMLPDENKEGKQK